MEPPLRRWLVERDRELDAIDHALSGAVAGEGSLVLFEGPAGIGKTALLNAARERAGPAGVETVSACGVELEGGFPYGVVRQLLEPTVRAAQGARRNRLFAGAAGLAAPALLGPQSGLVDPEDAAFALAHGLYWLVANLAAQAPAALLVDDVHWADPPSLRFLSYLARRLDGLAVSVIACARTGEGGSDQGLLGDLSGGPRAQVAAVAALSEAAVTTVLAGQFGQEPEAQFARLCRKVTGGNPFYVRELAAALIADGIEPTKVASEQISAAAPQTIARATLGRLGHLSEDAVGLARAIAVLGSDARLPRAAALAGLDDAPTLAALDALVAADVLSTDGALEFRHPIVRAAIYDELSPGARSIAHRGVAALLAAEGEELDAVAGHLLLSEPVGAPATVATLREAAQHALTLGAPDIAAAYLSRALEERPQRELRATVLYELALAEKLARLPTAIEHLVQVRRLAEDPVTRGRAMIEQGEILAYRGDSQQSLALFDAALAELGDRDRPGALRAEALWAVWAAYDPRLIDSFMERLPRLSEVAVTGGEGTRPLAMLLAARAAQKDEPPDRVHALVELGWAEGRYLTDGDSSAMLPQGIGALIICDDLDRARDIVGAVRDAAQASGSVLQYLVASAHDAFIEARLGNLATAAADMRASLERALELGLQFATTQILSFSTEVLLERPDVADLAEITEKIDLGAMAGALAGAMLIETRGRLRFAAGQSAAAIADLRHAGAISDALGLTNPPAYPSWRSTLALMLGPSERDEALALVRAELTDARRIGRARRIGVALSALGTLEADGDTARSLLEEAVSVLSDSPARLEHARALVALGAAERRRGNRAAARRPLRDGLDLAAHCGAIRLAERARAELAATGARPRREYATGPDALTPSELRVALLAADGRTTQEIAQALFVTTKTIDTHLNHTYSKLGINSRRQLAAGLAREPTGGR